MSYPTDTLTRWNDNGPLQQDYLTDCDICGREHARSDLFWVGDDLVCDDCDPEA
jgi:hypothetical protein